MNLNETKVRTSVYLYEFCLDKIKKYKGYGAISEVCNEAILREYIGLESRSTDQAKLRKAVIKKMNEGSK